MGMPPLFSSCSSDCHCGYCDSKKKIVYRDRYIEVENKKPQNPNPLNFKIEKIVQIGRYTLAQIHYIGCTNYEGKKILLWHGHTIKSISDLRAIDPHFTDSMYSPIARFEPTVRGWKMAEKVAKIGL